MSEPVDLAVVEAARFEPLLHEKFSALPWEGVEPQVPAELELMRVTTHALEGVEGRRVPFSLFFHGPVGVSLGQGTYTIEHPGTGPMLLFLVPVGRRDNRLELQSVLN